MCHALLGVTHYVDIVLKTLIQTPYLQIKEHLSLHMRANIHYGLYEN
jgi:hypothetical protein